VSRVGWQGVLIGLVVAVAGGLGGFALGGALTRTDASGAAGPAARIATAPVGADPSPTGDVGLPPALASAIPAGAPPDFAALAARLAPAVVAITTAQDVDAPATFAEGSPLERYEDLMRGGPRVENSLGSGFIVREDGIVVTNNHVIEGADAIEVTLSDGRTLPAAVVGRDPATDIAVLRVDAPAPLPWVAFSDGSSGEVGQWVMAIGNPFGLGPSISVGVVSARNRDIGAGAYDDFIQTDAAINRGNSGGPLFDMGGRVIGVNTAIVSPTGQSVGVGFATPANMIQTVVDQILQFGTTRRGWLGIRVAAIDEVLARRLSLPETGGAVVSHVAPDGPAARAGLQRGDVILTFGETPLREARRLARLVADTPIGTEVVLRVLRGGEQRELRVTVARLDQSDLLVGQGTGGEPRTPAQTSALGITFAEISPTLRRRFGLPADQQGVIVLSVAPDSPAHERLLAGDVVTAMSFTPIETLADAQSALERAMGEGGANLLLEIVREGQTSFRSIPKRTP